MEYRRFQDKVIIRLDPGEEVNESVLAIFQKENITLAEVRGLGALNDFSVGLFDTAEKKFHGNHFTIPVEIASLWGTVTTQNGQLYPHFHLSCGDIRGQVYGGHMQQGVCSATCELVMDVLDGIVERKFSPEIGLNLLEFV